MKIKIQAFLAQDSFAAFARVAAWLVGPQDYDMASCRRQGGFVYKNNSNFI